jgi:5-methyltetrahydrofolate--homocysteine methyltransferase
MMHAKPFCIGLNCALGADKMKPFIQRLSQVASCYVHAYANAGLPNALGGYDETPESFSANAKEFCGEGFVNMIGGCCGTTPIFIKHVFEACKDLPRRVVAERSKFTMLSGLQEFIFRDNLNFVNVGERCNIAGSIAFKKLIVDG